MNETSVDRLSRLLSLVPWLAGRSSTEPVTITEAAERFGVSPERLESDLWLLVCCGLPGYGPEHLIDIQFWDDDGLIDVLDPQNLSAPASLTFDEAIALQLGLQMLDSVASPEDRPLIHETMRVLAEATAGAIDTERASISGAASAEVTAVVHEALRSSRALTIEYFSATRDATSIRIIHPRQLVFSENRPYLQAWCTTAKAQRTFRLDRMLAAELGQPVSPRDVADDGSGSEDPAWTGDPAWPGDPAGGGEPRPTMVHVRIATRARWLLDSYAFELVTSSDSSHAEAGDDEGGGDEWIEARLPVWDRDWFIRLVLGQGGDLICDEPSEWRTDIARRARASLAMAGSPNDRAPDDQE